MLKNISKNKTQYFILLCLGCLSIFLAIFLSVKTTSKIKHRLPPITRETNVNLIQGWMTIPYVSRTFGVPRPILFSELNLDQYKYSKLSIDAISKQTDTSSALIIEKIKSIIINFQSAHQSPPPKNQ